MSELVNKPIDRSPLRLTLGRAYYGLLRRGLWIRMRKQFAQEKSAELLPYTAVSHAVPLLRRLRNVDMQYQYNKVINLKLAVPQVDGILLHPGETFSYWKLIGKPSRAKGYVDGMILRNGGFTAALGGGLCQLSNLIFWMTLHTPLTVIERHRHGYDVFPDSNRTQPFGSGATCFYPYGDLMIRNDTEDVFQLCVQVGETHLEGTWRVSAKPHYLYKIVERNHRIQGEYWGGYSRHNQLYQQKWSLEGELLEERLIVENSAIMMYSPLIDSNL